MKKEVLKMFKKEGMVSKIIGVAILIIIIVVVIVIKNNGGLVSTASPIYDAVGGGKEDLLADETINEIFANKYKFKLVNDSWSNGRTVKIPVLREDGSHYDLIFFSDQRYYDYYKTSPTGEEAARDYVLDGSLTLNTPIVIYSWDT